MSETKLKRQIIFVSGAYRSKYGIIGRAVNIWKAYQVARRLVRQGYSCYIPHMNTALMDGLQSEDWFLEATLKMLPKCQIIYMMKGWENSEGAKMELLEADKRGMDIIYEYKNEYLHQFSPADIIRGYTLKDVEAIIDSNPNWGKLAGCTEPVTVPYKLEPEVKL